MLTSKYHQKQANQTDQVASYEQTNSAARSMRKTNTWTRSSKHSSSRDIISPIEIPTFRESSPAPSQDHIPISVHQNYDADEFERYSPTPPSTPKYQDQIEIKNLSPSIRQDFNLHEEQKLIRPVTYKKTKRSEGQQEKESEL